MNPNRVQNNPVDFMATNSLSLLGYQAKLKSNLY